MRQQDGTEIGLHCRILPLLRGQLGENPICLLQVGRGVCVCRPIEISQAEVAAGKRGIRFAPRLQLGISVTRFGLLRARQARNAVIRDGRMGHVSGSKPGHVTAHAFGGCLMTPRREEIVMAGEAYPPDDLRPVRLAGMRVVASAAPQAAATLPGALALGQQFALAHRPQRAGSGSPQVGDKNAFGSLARLEVPPIAAGIQYPDFSFQVALLAYAVTAARG